MARFHPLAAFALTLVPVTGCERSHSSTAEPPAKAGATVATPRGGPGWADTTSLSLKDSWGGLGCSHSLTVELTRQGSELVGEASLAVDGVERRPVKLALTALAPLEQAVAAALVHPLPADPDPKRLAWTDDFPRGALRVRGPAGEVHLHFENQRRQLHLERDGKSVALDPPFDFDDRTPRPVWRAYRALIDDSLGVGPWIEARCSQ